MNSVPRSSTRLNRFTRFRPEPVNTLLFNAHPARSKYATLTKIVGRVFIVKKKVLVTTKVKTGKGKPPFDRRLTSYWALLVAWTSVTCSGL